MKKIIFFILIVTAGCKNREASLPVSSGHARPKEISTAIKVGFWDVYKRLVLPSDGMQLNASSKICDINNNKHTLGQLITRPTLIFRYSFRDCDMCVDPALSALKRNKFYSSQNTIIITDALSFRDYAIRVKALACDIPVYWVQSEDMRGLGLPIENKNIPFFFVLGPDLKASKFFIPYKEITDETLSYLNLAVDFLKK